MRMLPSKIKVGPTEFKVRRTKDVDVDSRWAETDHFRREIRFGLFCDPEQMVETLIHELLHAVWQQYGLKDLDNSDMSERVVTSLALGMTQVMQDLGFLPKRIKLHGE